VANSELDYFVFDFALDYFEVDSSVANSELDYLVFDFALDYFVVD